MNEKEKRPVILIADDSPSDRMLLLRIFSDEYQVEQAENGVQALDMLREWASSGDKDVAAVILNLQIPELDGYGVLKAMREDERLRNIPVVADTANGDVESQMKALDCGAVDVLIKPFDPRLAWRRLRSAVENITGKMRMTEQLTAIMDSVPGGILDFEVRDSVRTVYYNDTAAAMFGYSREEYGRLFAETPLAAIHPDDVGAIQMRIGDVIGGGEQTLEAKYRHKCADGSWRWVRLTGHVVRRKGKQLFASGILLDIDSEVRNEEIAARQAADIEHQRISLQTLYDTIPCGIMQFSAATDIRGMTGLLGLNDTAWRIYGYDSRTQYVEAVHGKSKLKDIYTEDLPDVQRCIEVLHSAEDGGKMDCDHRIVRPDGSVRWVRAILQKVRYPNKEEVIQVVFNDITDRKQASLQKLSTALFRLYDEVFEIDVENDLCFMRSSKREDDSRLGRFVSFRKHLDTICEKLAYRDEWQRIRAFYDRAGQKPPSEAQTLEYRYMGESGEQRWAAATLLHLSGSLYLTCSRDITEQKNAQHIMKENELLQSLVNEHKKETERNRIFIESTGILVYDYDPDSDTLKIQRKDAELGIVEETTEHYIAMISDNPAISAEDRERIRDIFHEVMRSPVSRTVEYRSNRLGGKFGLCRAHFASIADESGKIYRIIGQVSELQEGEKTASISAPDYEEPCCDAAGLSEGLAPALEESSAYIYVVDRDTCEVLYVNKAMKTAAGDAVGDVCYRAFTNGRAMCSACPIKQLGRTGAAVPVKMCRDGRCFIMQAFPAAWHGRRAVMLSGTDIRSFSENPESEWQSKYRKDMSRYTQALFGLFDEIFEMDFCGDVFKPLVSRWPDVCKGKEHSSLHEAIENWSSRFTDEKERDGLLKFLDLRSIQKAFRSGGNPSLEYSVRISDGTEHICRSTLLQLDAGRYLCCNKDVTEQKKAEQLQKEVAMLKAKTQAQDRCRIIVEQTGTAVVDMNYQTGEFSCSEAYGKYEASRHSQMAILSNAGDSSLVHRDDKAALEKFFASAGKSSEHAEAVLRLKMVDGSFRWNRMAGTFFRDASGKLTRIICTFTDIDAEMRSRNALEQLSERMRRIIANIPTGVAIYEVGEKILPVYVSDKTCEMFGFSREECDLRIANGEAVGFTPGEDVIPKGGMEKMLSGQPLVIQKLRVEKKDGSRLWIRAFCSMTKNKDGALLCYVVLADITDEMTMERKYMWQTERYKILSESMDIITFDYSPQDDAMRVSLLLPGKGLTEEVHERYLETLAAYGRISDAEKDGFAETLRAAVSSAISGTYDFEADYYGNGMRWYRAKYVSLADESGQVYRVVGRLDDINDIITTQNQLRADAQMDEVTGIHNKNYAMSAIAKALAERSAGAFDAVLFMDVDNFKGINDTYGHLEADRVLRRIGTGLRELFRQGDVVARFGGDEFIVYMRSAGGMDAVTNRASEIIRSVNNIEVKGKRPVCCSIGIAAVADRELTYEKVIRQADTALYEAKANGKNRYVVFEG